MIRNAIKIVFLGLGLLLFACHPNPANMRQAGRDALENGRIQLDSGNKAESMRFFKEAEHYGMLADDTLTVAHARLNIADCLGFYGEEEEVVLLLKAAEEGFGDDYANRAKALMVLGNYYQFHEKYDTAEMYLEQALDYAELGNSLKSKCDALSILHVLYFNNGNYEKSADYLQQFFQASMPYADNDLLMHYYYDMGNIFYKWGCLDSAVYYYSQLEELVNKVEPNEKTWGYYDMLASFAEGRGDFETACEYYYLYDKGAAKEDIERQENNLALISNKYDSVVMQNELNQRIIRKQRFIILISGLAAIVLAAFLISQIHLAKKRKQEAEINAELFHFKQQNQALAQKDAEREQIQQDYTYRLSDALDKEQRIMLLLDNYLNNKRANLLNDLEQSVFGDKDHWKAMLAVVEEKYPGLWETLGQKYPDLDEDEKKSFILSHFKVSRQEEADYLGTTVNMVDKLRGRVRKKMAENQ